MDISLKDKIAVVCGSTQGIGLAIAEELASNGATIILIARNESKLKEVAQKLNKSQGQTHHFLVVDFNDPAILKNKLNHFLESQSRLDILINNTGGPPAGKVIEADPEEFMTAFKQHVICNQILVQAVVPFMKKNQYGRIVNIISTSVKMPLPGLGVSNTIRGAVANWSKTLSQELGPYGITVNNVLPGATETGRLDSIIKNKAQKSGLNEEEVQHEMKAEIPVGRFAKTEDLAVTVAFLVSPAASYINGVNVPVDGGRTGCL